MIIERAVVEPVFAPVSITLESQTDVDDIIVGLLLSAKHPEHHISTWVRALSIVTRLRELTGSTVGI